MTTRIARIDEIQAVLGALDLVPLIEEAFLAYSDGRAVVPPTGGMTFTDPVGDVHIKYGYLIGDRYYVIKVASGFYDNPSRGMPVGQGLMLVFDQTTGQPLCVLLDDGHLTRVRTAVAGAIAAKHLAPRAVSCVGIVGTGVQARLQLEHLAPVIRTRAAMVLGRSSGGVRKYIADMESYEFIVTQAHDAQELGAACNLIVTTTNSRKPVLRAEDIRPGTHITAVGADTPQKQELDTAILGRADVIVADSVAQCLLHGEIAHALRAAVIDEADVVELGRVIGGAAPGRTSDDQITIADLTGVAVQDIQIAKAVYERLETPTSNRQDATKELAR